MIAVEVKLTTHDVNSPMLGEPNVKTRQETEAEGIVATKEAFLDLCAKAWDSYHRGAS